MKKSDENTPKTAKTTKKDTLIECTVDYKNQMAVEKLRKLHLANEHQSFDLQKKQDTICYKAVAMKEFEKAIGNIYARIKNADEQLCDRLQLNINQADILHDYMESILEDLSNIDIELESTEAFDVEHYYDGKAKKSQLLNS